jgi:hypothetical protein
MLEDGRQESIDQIEGVTLTFADEKRSCLMREDGAGFEQSRSSLGV